MRKGAVGGEKAKWSQREQDLLIFDFFTSALGFVFIIFKKKWEISQKNYAKLRSKVGVRIFISWLLVKYLNI